MLAFRLLGEPLAGRLKKDVPVVTGRSTESKAIAQFFELRWSDLLDPEVRTISVASGRIDFMDEGATRFSLRL